MWNIALGMAKANLREVVRDRRAILLMFLMPLVLISILSFALGDLFGGKSVPPFTVSVYNADGGQISTGLVKTLDSVKPQITVELVASKSAALSSISNNNAAVAVVIPNGLQKNVLENKSMNVEVLAPLNNDTKRQIVESIVNAFGKQAGDERYIAQKTHSLELTSQNLNVKSESTGMHPLTSGSYYAIGMMAMFMLTTATNRAGRMVEERFSDRYKRLMASPATRHALTFGYFISYWVLILMQGAILLLASRFILGITLGPITQVAVLLVSYSAALSGITLLVGTTMKTPQMMDSLGGVASQILAVLGGSIFPLYQFPGIVQSIGNIIPNGRAITAFDNSVLGTTFITLMPSIAYLLLFGVVFGLLSGFWFGRSTKSA